MKLFLIFFLLLVQVQSHEQCSCPESCSQKEELGRGTWFLIHSIVKHMEKTPDNELLFFDFMDTLSQLYPCDECREHFIANLKEIDQIEMTEQWACLFHNRINEQLDKPLYPCPDVESSYSMK